MRNKDNMRISLSLNKSVEENAARYFEKAKKDRQKLQGTRDALQTSRKKLTSYRKAEKPLARTESRLKKRRWYEKFRWFYSSQGMLVLGGRDSTTNEILIKKHAEKDDLVFHTDMAGSPFFVVKTEGKDPLESTMHEAATATAAYSRAWKLGLGRTDVFYVSPEQVSKQAKSGESLPKGAFMIYGKTNYLEHDMELAIGIAKDDGSVIGGPKEAIETHSEKAVLIVQGNDKPSDAAKKISSRIGGEIDEIIRFLPSGGCKVI